MEVTSALQTEQHVKNELAKRLGELQENLGELKETVSPEPWQTDNRLEGGGRLGQDKAAPASGRGGGVVCVCVGGHRTPRSFPACLWRGSLLLPVLRLYEVGSPARRLSPWLETPSPLTREQETVCCSFSDSALSATPSSTGHYVTILLLTSEPWCP